MNPNLLSIADLDEPIYRIFSAMCLLKLLRTGKNGLVNPAKWDDPFENFFLRARVIGPHGEKISMSGLAEDWYGQCWTFNNDTDAMWRIYSRKKDGIQIKTTIRKLFENLYDKADTYASQKFFCGRVRYLSEDEIDAFMNRVAFRDIAFGGQASVFADLLCVKREAFAHEKEIRLLFHDLGDPKRGANGVALFDFDVTICDEIVLDPRLSDEETQTLTQQINAAGCSLPISRSTLYRMPRFTIDLQ